jgi:hypothetical protein
VQKELNYSDSDIMSSSSSSGSEDEWVWFNNSLRWLRTQIVT